MKKNFSVRAEKNCTTKAYKMVDESIIDSWKKQKLERKQLVEIYIQKVLLMKKGKQLARPEAMTKVKTQPRGLRQHTKTKKLLGEDVMEKP